MKHSSRFARLALVSSLFALASFGIAACGDDGGVEADSGPIADSGPDAGPADASPACAEATQHSDFTWINTNIFGKSCANFSACHDSSSPAAMLDLTAANAYAKLIDVPSVQVSGKKLVDSSTTTATDCVNSYLYDKVANVQIATGKKSMPLNSPLLCQEKIDAVCRWIAAGAPNN